MKSVKLEWAPELDGILKKNVDETGEFEPISLERGGSAKAVIISIAEYNALRKLEEAALDKLDVEESEEILKDPKWIGWAQLRVQPKS